jgi:hypothetical protein
VDVPGDRRRDRRDGLTEDPLGAPAGGTLTGRLDASGADFGLFDEACAGPAPPAALPATLVLYRLGLGRGGASTRERGGHHRRHGRPSGLISARGGAPGRAVWSPP